MNTLHVIRKSIAIMLALLILLSLVAPVVAQENSAAQGGNVSTAPSEGRGPTDPAELEAFLDELLARQMEEYHIAGAAVSVVKDGKLFLAKGYGYADLENGTRVHPERTIFRIAQSARCSPGRR